MNLALRNDPLTYEFASEQQANEYDVWFRTKVQEALNSDEKNDIPHDEVVARMRAKLADFIGKQHSRPIVPMVMIDLKDDEASKRLIKHAAQRVIKEHKQELVQLAYK